MSTRSGKTYNNLHVDIPARANNNRNRIVSPLRSPFAMLAAAAAVTNANPMVFFWSMIMGFIVAKATGTYNLFAAILAWFFADQYRPLLLLSAYILVFLIVSGIFHAIARQVGKHVPSFDMFFSSWNQTNGTHDFTNFTNRTNFSNFNTTNATSYESRRNALFQRLKNVSVGSAILPMVTLGAMFYMEALFDSRL